MELIKTEEIQENELTYIVNTYSNGTVEKYIKPDPDYVPPVVEPQQEPVTNEEIKAKMDQLEQQNVAIMMGMVDVFAAVTSVDGGAE